MTLVHDIIWFFFAFVASAQRDTCNTSNQKNNGGNECNDSNSIVVFVIFFRSNRIYAWDCWWSSFDTQFDIEKTCLTNSATIEFFFHLLEILQTILFEFIISFFDILFLLLFPFLLPFAPSSFSFLSPSLFFHSSSLYPSLFFPTSLFPFNSLPLLFSAVYCAVISNQ